jgi:Family of unknown function (DUF6600)/FecR protein
MTRLRAAALWLALVISGTGLAQEADYAPEADPPSRVARISYIQGQVYLQAADAGAPEEAVLNRPLTISDRLTTERGSRAELSVGTAALRVDEYSDLTIANLDQDIAQIALNSGTLGIHVRELRETETFEIDTPNATVRLLRPGDYRVEADEQGATALIVRSGDAELDNGNGPIRLRDGQRVRLAAGDQYADVQNLTMQDAFDAWCIERERGIAEAESTRYVSRDVVGYEDLDAYGSWYSEPGYGAVWAPSVVIVGWAPYRYGRWTWISPWGWTWVDRAPWGFAPFHYGRWAHLSNRWCWVPGPRFHRPVWAPGLVAWQRGPGFGDPNTRPVSWIPLGPREVYVPSKNVSPRYLRNVNIANTAINNNAYITNVARDRVRDIRYANRNVPGAVTTVPRTAFNTPRPGPRPVWTGDFRDNARLQRGPDRSQPQPRPGRDRDTWRDPRPRSGQPPDKVAPPTALAPVNTDRRTGDGRMTVPRAPTERRQIQSDGNWKRIDGQAASFARPMMQRPIVEPRGERTDRAVKTMTPPPAVIRVAPNSSANRARAVSMPQRNESSGSNRGGSASSGRDQGRSAGFVNRADSAAPRGQLSRSQANFNRP